MKSKAIYALKNGLIFSLAFIVIYYLFGRFGSNGVEKFQMYLILFMAVIVADTAFFYLINKPEN